MVRRQPSCRPGSRGAAPGCRGGIRGSAAFPPARKFGQPSCRARQPRCRARLPGRHLRCRGPGAAAAEMRWRFTSRAYLEVSRSDLLVKGSSTWQLGCRARGTRGAGAAPGLPRRPPELPPPPGLPARQPRPAPGLPARQPRPAAEVPPRQPRCRHHTERKLAGHVDSPSRAQIALPRWLHTPVGVPWR